MSEERICKRCGKVIGAGEEFAHNVRKDFILCADCFYVVFDNIEEEDDLED